MLLVAILSFPLSSSAEEFTLVPTQSTIIQADGTSAQNADVVLFGQDLHCSQAKISGGAFTNMLQPYEGSPVVITKFDASEILNGKSLKSAVLTFNAKCTVSGKNSNVQIASIGTNWDATTATWNNTNTSEILNAVNLNGDGVNVKTLKMLTQDVTEILKADEDKVIGFAIYTFTGRDQAISDLKLTIEAIDASASSTYTVKFVDGSGNEIKTSDTRSESIGAGIVLTDEDKAAVYNEDHTVKYIYVSDDATDKTVAADGSTVITVTFREAATWNYTINAVDGDGNTLKTLKTGTNFEAEKFDVAYAAFINVDGTLYTSSKLSSDKKGYYFTMTLSEDNLTQNVTFTASSTTNVVYFSEGEDIEGLTPSNNANTFIRSSNGASAYAADDVVFTSLPNGKYKLTTVICDVSKNAGSVWNFKAGDKNIFEFTATSVNWAQGTSEEFELNDASTDITLVKNGGNNQGVDLIYIVKTGDAELAAPTPATGKMDFSKMDLPMSSGSSTAGDITEDKTFTADEFSVTISPKVSGTNNRIWDNKGVPQLRIYSGTLTVKAAAGKTLTKIVFDQSKWGTISANVGTLTAQTWTGEAEEVVFTVTAQCQINSITVGEAPTVDAANIAAFKALETGTKAKLAVNGAKVTFVSGDYTYIEDETGALLLFKTGLTLTAGKAITGFIYGAHTVYGGLDELTATEETTSSEISEADADITATVMTVAEANVVANASKLVKLENVNINADLQTITQGEDEIAFYDKFKVMDGFTYPATAKSIVGIINTAGGYNTFHPVGPDYVVADTPAEDEEIVALTADMFYTWDGYGADASKLSPAQVEFYIGNGSEIGAGGMVCGTSTVDHLTYADVTGYSKMIIEGTPGMALRVLMNRQGEGGALTENNPTIGEDGTVELNLTDLEYVHINAIKVNWGSAAGQITSIKLVKPSDALAIPKEALKNAIENAKLYNAVAKTEESFAKLQTAIANGETALAAGDATEESLVAAKNAIEEAIAGLTLQEGYSNLTKEMFMEYASFDEPGEGKAAYGAYSLFEGTGLPYGDGNVNYLSWADLTAYDKLIITTVGETKPRLCLNRLTPDGQQAETKEDSKMLDINPNNDVTWSNDAYQTIDGNVYTIDLKKIVEDYTFARLHCIKKQGWGPDVFVTGMYLYSAAEETMPVAENIAAAKEADVRDKEIKLNVTGAKVTLYGGNNMTESFIEDETGALMVDFNITKLLGEDGVALTGYIIGKVTKDQRQGGIFKFEGTDNTASSEITKEATEIVPTTTTIADINAGQVADVTSKYIRLENVNVKYESTGWSADISLVDGDQELSVNDAMFVLPEDMSIVEKFNSISGIVIYGYNGLEFVPYGTFDAVEKQIEFTEVANIAALKDIANDTDVKLALNNTQIKVLEGGRWDKAIYIEDETAGIQINDNEGTIFTEFGQTFNGYIYLKYKDEYGVKNLETAGYTKNSEYTVEVKEVVAKEVAWADATSANYNQQLIKVNNVELAVKTITEGEGEDAYSYPVLYLKSGDKEMNMSDMFNKAYDENGGSLEPGMYNITGIIMEGPVYDENYEVAGYADYFIPTGETAFEAVTVEPVADLRKWDFRAWSEETVANMAADAATIVPTENEDGTLTYPSVTPWRTYEKVGGPTEAEPDHGGNAYWYGTEINGSEELTANGVVIAETKGLLFNTMAAGALAVGINYPSTSLGTYAGPSYLWIGGKNNSFTIPTVKSGSKVYIGIESHKNTDARGVKLTINGVELGQAVPKTFEEFVFTVPGETTDGTASDIVVTNTNGCHIYYIYVDATGEIDGINDVKANVDFVNSAVYTINGVKVRNAGDSLEGLAKGIYIIGGKKVVVK